MQFLQVPEKMSLSNLRERVGTRNLDSVLNLNSISRTPIISKALKTLYDNTISMTDVVDSQRKMTVLNSLTNDADVFETAALLDENGWKLLSSKGTMPSMLRIPETITLPDASDIIGGTNIPVDKLVYDRAMNYLRNNQAIDPIIFNTYNMRRSSQIYDTASGGNPIQWFNIPWGKISLYSSLSGTSVDFPVFPETYSDGYKANYDTMPDMLYQYEPWYTYKGSGPRSNDYVFKMHRDMWSGDHRDGKCNDLIRFCEANCYPDYNGAAVNTSTVTLYISGKALISGILTDVKVEYDGPVGLDDFPLVVELTLSITEVATAPVTHTTMLRRGIIG